MKKASVLYIILLTLTLSAGTIYADKTSSQPLCWKFDFGTDLAAEGCQAVTPDILYASQNGFGFLPGADIAAGTRNTDDPLLGDFCGSEKPFLFSLDVPQEGNYRVTLTCGRNKPSTIVLKAESRRLMLENIEIHPDIPRTCTVVVNVRNSKLPDGRSVKLKARETDAFHWDNALTLEFNGQNPAVCAMRVEKADDLPTIFLAGDSTVTDQTREPWTSWGQMLPRFFKPVVAIANYAESGETLSSFIGERRLEKLLTQMKPGDYLFVQFAHNDMKRGTPRQVGYQDSLRHFITEARRCGAHPVLVTSMHRRRFDDNGKVIDTMQGFPEAMKDVAIEQNVPLIDLHAMSRLLYEAWGPDGSAAAFVDGTHHNAYGAYELAKCVVEGIRLNIPELAAWLTEDVLPFDPARPDPPETFTLPASPMWSDIKPEGS